MFPVLRVIHVGRGQRGAQARGGSVSAAGQAAKAFVEDEMEDMGAVPETRGRVLSLAMYLGTIQE